MVEGTESSPSIREQVAAHERDIANLTGTVGRLADTLEETAKAQWDAIHQQGENLRTAIEAQGDAVRKEISALSMRFSESRSVSWPLVVSLVAAGLMVTSLAVTIMTVIGSMALSPIRQRLDEHLSDGHPYRVEKQVAAQSATTRERFSEIETQFQGMQTRQNLVDQQMFLFLNLTRRESGLEPLDVPPYWPAPFHRIVPPVPTQ